MWLWINCPKFTVRVECNHEGKIKTLPPILIKKYKHFFGHPYKRFVHQILHDYQHLNTVIIQCYNSDGYVTEMGWKE